MPASLGCCPPRDRHRLRRTGVRGNPAWGRACGRRWGGRRVPLWAGCGPPVGLRPRMFDAPCLTRPRPVHRLWTTESWGPPLPVGAPGLVRRVIGVIPVAAPTPVDDEPANALDRSEQTGRGGRGRREVARSTCISVSNNSDVVSVRPQKDAWDGCSRKPGLGKDLWTVLWTRRSVLCGHCGEIVDRSRGRPAGPALTRRGHCAQDVHDGKSGRPDEFVGRHRRALAIVVPAAELVRRPRKGLVA